MPKSRRYRIEITEIATGKIVVFTGADGRTVRDATQSVWCCALPGGTMEGASLSPRSPRATKVRPGRIGMRGSNPPASV
jgi:hypothetical protein